MKTTTILWATEEAMNQHNCYMHAYTKHSRKPEYLQIGKRRGRQHDKFYQRLLSRIDAGDRAREVLKMYADGDNKSGSDRAREAYKRIKELEANNLDMLLGALNASKTIRELFDQRDQARAQYEQQHKALLDARDAIKQGLYTTASVIINQALEAYIP